MAYSKNDLNYLTKRLQILENQRDFLKTLEPSFITLGQVKSGVSTSITFSDLSDEVVFEVTEAIFRHINSAMINIKELIKEISQDKALL